LPKFALKKEDIVTFNEKSMILGYDKDTEKRVLFGEIYI
jgi:hypothetical protein